MADRARDEPSAAADAEDFASSVPGRVPGEPFAEAGLSGEESARSVADHVPDVPSVEAGPRWEEPVLPVVGWASAEPSLETESISEESAPSVVDRMSGEPFAEVESTPEGPARSAADQEPEVPSAEAGPRWAEPARPVADWVPGEPVAGSTPEELNRSVAEEPRAEAEPDHEPAAEPSAGADEPSREEPAVRAEPDGSTPVPPAEPAAEPSAEAEQDVPPEMWPTGVAPDPAEEPDPESPAVEPEVPAEPEPSVWSAPASSAEPRRAAESDRSWFDPGGDAPAEAAVPPIARGGHAKAEGPDAGAPSLTERVLGCFLGGALGDALGADLEFRTAEEIGARFGPEGPRGLPESYGVRGAFTDDTQMTLFTAEGLIRGSAARRMLDVADPLPEVQHAYQRWLHTQGVDWDAAAGPFLAERPVPDGWLIEVPGLFKTRAPGKTVFRALTRFGDGHPPGSFTEPVNDSKGCGGVMRAAPVALCSTDPAEVFELAARTAALTHGHPAGFHSAGALAVIVQQALLGRTLDDGVWLALQVLETWSDHEETSAMLKAAVDLAGSGVPTPRQVAEVLGGGWVGEQALAIAVCAALVGGEDVALALRVAVHHDGDSDSTGAICGNIVGALLGVGALPVDWLAELELRDVVEQIALDCVAEFGRDAFQPGHSAIDPPTDEDWQERYPVRPQWSAPAEPAPVAEFPAPKPAPRRINGVVYHDAFEGEQQ
ncbi:ADP-ribosylglycohydrolase family protein [Saccharopolyspora sp. CA-218241]|uniref:ADP-ribosylglycohydrolase family protein n=1 Tax=Saccharopolyspora sp. CA-218241 TaxID=3240027 RepID=UPI003D9999D1